MPLHLLHLLLLLQLLITLVNAGELSCQPVSGCRCDGSGFQLDISGLFSYPLTITAGVQNFSFSPCAGLKCTGSQLAAMCQIYSSTSLNSCGKTSSSVWSVNSLDPLSFVVTYNGGDPVATTGINRYSVVTFTATTDPNTKLSYGSYGGPSTPSYTFTVQGQAVASARVQSEDLRGIVGIVLICLVIGGVIAYLIGGSTLLYSRGARGQEMIPHVRFWKDVPFLIKDGIRFTLTLLYSGIQLCFRRNYDKL
eukprot:Em0006g697a